MKNRTALIVEDDTLVALAQKEILLVKGFSVIGIAKNAGDAMKIASKTQPDLVLCDVHIKGELDGIDLMKKIRLNGSCKLIFLSNYLDENITQRINELLPCYYISKPFSELELKDTIDLMFSPTYKIYQD